MISSCKPKNKRPTQNVQLPFAFAIVTAVVGRLINYQNRQWAWSSATCNESKN